MESESMTGLAPKPVKLNLTNGQVYTLHPISFETLIDLEEQFGVTLENFNEWLTATLKTNKGVFEFIAILAQPTHPGITYKDIARNTAIAGNDQKNLLVAINKVLKRSFPGGESAPLVEATEEATAKPKKKKVAPR